MAEHVVRILAITKLTHNVKAYRVEKPKGYDYHPGQAADVAVKQGAWVNEIRPFTFTSIPSDAELEFVIKSYRDHTGVTKLIDTLKRDAELVISDPWGSLAYRGPGLFLAGGTGITPFLSMFRQLALEGRLEGNRLLWANSTEHDHFLQSELKQLLGSNYVPVVGHPKSNTVKRLLRPATDWAYVCGPEAFEAGMHNLVAEHGIPTNRILQEED